jgi:hypothetical protein
MHQTVILLAPGTTSDRNALEHAKTRAELTSQLAQDRKFDG